MFELNAYEIFVEQTAIYPAGDSDYYSLAYPTLGLVGEAGEFANKVKKLDRDENGKCSPERRAELVDELGDCLWYLTRLAHTLGCNLSDVANVNKAKLQSRVERGVLSGSGDHR